MVDITTAPSLTTIHEGSERGMSAKDAAFNAEARVQARAVEDARHIGRVDRDLVDDLKVNALVTKDASILGVARNDDHERRVLVTQHETRELVRLDGEKTRELLHQQSIRALERENLALRTDGRFAAIDSMLRALVVKAGATIAA